VEIDIQEGTMTEAEARTKRCPILRIITIDRPEEVTFTRFPNCIASDCMMWRLSYAESDDGFCGLGGGTGAVFGQPPLTTSPITPPLPPSSPQVNPLRPSRRQ
jgi:hypothetical protein